jgi:hypothetical protein
MLLLLLVLCLEEVKKKQRTVLCVELAIRLELLRLHLNDFIMTIDSSYAE